MIAETMMRKWLMTKLQRAVSLGILLVYFLIGGAFCFGAEDKDCFFRRDGDVLSFGNKAFVYQLELSSGPKAQFCENKLTGERVDLGNGLECGIRFSATLDRIELVDWRQQSGGANAELPGNENGFVEGFHAADFNDSAWESIPSPWALGLSGYHISHRAPNPGGYNWYRTTFDLPEAQGQPVTIGLGGCGVYDFGQQRFYLNGVLIGERFLEKQDWKDPTVITINPDDPKYKLLKFGQSNVIAVQAWKMMDDRPQRLQEVDKDHIYHSAILMFLMDQFVTVGPAYEDLIITGVNDIHIHVTNEKGHIKLSLETQPDFGKVVLNYEWTSEEAALRKWFDFTNESGQEKLLLDVDLGDYPITAKCNQGFQGFPVYLNDEIFCAIAHPAGVVQGSDQKRLRLRHFPGKYLKPGESLTSMTVVYGMAESPGQARPAFWKYLVARSHRMKLAERTGKKTWLHYDGLGHAWARPEPWGRIDPPSDNACLQVLDQLESFKEDYNLTFDYFWIDAGWWDYPNRFSLVDFNKDGFPNGPKKVVNRAKDIGMKAGLWFTRGSDCPVPEDVYKIWENAVRTQHDTYGFEGFKFDSSWSGCFRKDHADQHIHLPGKYSVQATSEGFIRIYTLCDEVSPEGWLFGYWGHDSPWWLLHVDTPGYHGLSHEMEHPCQYPTLYLRDSAILGWDQAQHYRWDVPPIGRYTCGTFTGDSGYINLGFDRWIQEQAINMCQGPALLHVWSEPRRWMPIEAARLGRFDGLMESHPDCFLNSKQILGDPWKGEVYGYACGDGDRTFMVVNNPTFIDQKIEIKLDEALGLTQTKPMQIYRHYPDPARLKTKKESWNLGDTLSWYARPNEIMLLEIAPAGQGTSLGQPWKEDALAEAPYNPAAIELDVKLERTGVNDNMHMTGEVPEFNTGALFVFVLTASKDGKPHPISSVPFDALGMVGPERIGYGEYLGGLTKVAGANWSVRKVQLPRADHARKIDIDITQSIPEGVDVTLKVYLMPWTPPDAF